MQCTMDTTNVVLRGVRINDVFSNLAIPGAPVAFCTVVKLRDEHVLRDKAFESVSEMDNLCHMMRILLGVGRYRHKYTLPDECLQDIASIWSGEVSQKDLIVVASQLDSSKVEERRDYFTYHILVPWMRQTREYVYFVYNKEIGLGLPLVFVRGSGSSERWMYSFKNNKLLQ